MFWIFITWIGVLPFVLLYGVYEGPKVWWVWGGGFVLTVCWIYLLMSNYIQGISRVGRWLLAWISMLAIASLFGVHPWLSFIGGSYRHQGVLFFFTLLLIHETILFLPIHMKRALIFLLGWGVMLESGIILVQKFLSWEARPLGTFGEPNAVAGYLAIGLYWVVQMRLRRYLKFILILFALLAILATESRTGILAAVVTIWGIASKLSRSSKRYMLVGTLGVAIAVGIIIGYIFAARPSSPFENRPMFWGMAVKAIVDRPILGYGAESGEVVYDRIYARENIRLFDFMVERSHNIFIDVSMWSGIVGLIIFGRWLWAMVVDFRHDATDRLWVFGAWILFASLQPISAVHWVSVLLLSGLYDLPMSRRGSR